MWRQPSQSRSDAAHAFHLVVLALAIAGLLAGGVRGRRGDLLLITSVILSSTLLHALLVAQPRYAMPLIALLAAGGAGGLTAIWDRRAASQRPAPRSQAPSPDRSDDLDDDSTTRIPRVP